MARPKAGYAIDGQPVPGVTTICGLLNKPALVGWAGKVCTAAAWQAGQAGRDMPKWVELLYGVRDLAADAGTMAHELFEARLRGREVVQPPPTEAGLRAWQAYENACHWLESSNLTITAHETPMVSQIYRYGGTPDALAEGNERVYGADWKTGGVYVEAILQQSAYRQLLNEVDGIRIEGAHLVRFSRDYADFADHYYASDALDAGWEVFQRLLEVYPIVKELEKRVK